MATTPWARAMSLTACIAAPLMTSCAAPVALHHAPPPNRPTCPWVDRIEGTLAVVCDLERCWDVPRAQLTEGQQACTSSPTEEAANMLLERVRAAQRRLVATQEADSREAPRSAPR